MSDKLQIELCLERAGTGDLIRHEISYGAVLSDLMALQARIESLEKQLKEKE
jgi:hypothetical protein